MLGLLLLRYAIYFARSRRQMAMAEPNRILINWKSQWVPYIFIWRNNNTQGKIQPNKHQHQQQQTEINHRQTHISRVEFVPIKVSVFARIQWSTSLINEIASAIVHVNCPQSEIDAVVRMLPSTYSWSLPMPENAHYPSSAGTGDIVMASFRFEPLQFILFIDIKSTRNSSISSENVLSPLLAASSFFFHPFQCCFVFARICGYFFLFFFCSN